MIAHEMPKLIGTVEHSIRLDLLYGISELLAKIDNWWIVNVEIAIDADVPDYTDEQLKEANSMNAIFIEMILPIAEGDDSKMRSLYQMWIEHQNKNEG